MRKAALVLGILGGIAAGILGMKWLGDASDLRELIDLARSAGADTAEIDRLVMAAYALIGAMVLGIVGGVLALKGQGKIAGGLMLLGVIVPAVLAPKSLVFTFILLIGGLVSLMAKPEAGKASGAAA